MKRTVFVLLLVTVVAVGTAWAQVQDAAQEERFARAAKRLALEPSIEEVQREAVKYYKVEPDRLDSLNTASNLRALLPSLSLRYAYGADRRVRTLNDNLVPLASNETYDTGAYGMSATASWDLPQLVFNAAELQTYALTGIRITVLKEVSRTYFIRRQVLLQLLVNPPKDPLARLGLEQRVLEFTALIDSFTGGFFSRELEARGLSAPTQAQ